MPDRRYSDKETAAIFRAATEGPHSPPQEAPHEDGLTLADLQAIGGEVGISPDAVARAAHDLERNRGVAARTFLGLPIGVSRTVNLNRRLSEEEWERLVVRLREVFNARGRMRSEGSLKQWTNGNLQVLLEPTESGHRLRFRTTHGAARASMGAGLAVIGVSAVTAISSAVSGSLGAASPGVTLLFLAGVGMIVSGALRLPRWARTRDRQMAALADQIAPPPELPPPPDRTAGQ
jgi:hypothetical protein